MKANVSGGFEMQLNKLFSHITTLEYVISFNKNDYITKN